MSCRHFEHEPTRRGFLQAAGIASVMAAGAIAVDGNATGASGARSALAYEHNPVPLPFDAARLKGLSERLIRSHWENNYGGAVKALNAVRSRLAAALEDEAQPPYLYNSLKKEQLARTGSVVLHELYFENLGGAGGTPSAELRTRIAASFGSYDAWETEFRRIGQGLGGGSGWVVLGYNRALGLLENYCLADHTQHPAHTDPVFVMDMYEHAYHIDYGAASAKYIDAFFANAQWDAVAGRLT